MKTKLLLAGPFAVAFLLVTGLIWGQDKPAQTEAKAQEAKAQAAKPADEQATAKKPDGEKPATDAEKAEAPKFIRLRRDDSNKPQAMETAVIRFVSEKRPGVAVDLIGAVHIGDKTYYDELNKLFESYEVLLYELVAPEGTTIPKGGRKGGNGHPIGALQDGMGSLLELQHQLACIDYTKANFVHADMSPEEFSKTMTDRGESFFQMFMRMMGQGMAQNAAGGKGGSNDVDLLFALFSRNRATRLKIAMAEQFENLEGQMSVLEDSTIIGQRNRKCFEVLEKQLKDGKKSIGVFYGAGHFPDMEKRLVADFGMKRESEKWLTAWQLAKKQAEQAQPKPVEEKRPALEKKPVEETKP